MPSSKDACYFFFSKAKGDAKLFSNFYADEICVTWPHKEAFPQFMRGLTRRYATAEHAYQALKALDLPSADHFALGGAFSSFEVFKRWPTRAGTKTNDTMQARLRHWGQCPGIIAKMASKVAPAVARKVWGVRFANRPLPDAVWRPILKAKYRSGKRGLGRALLETGAKHLVEFDRGATETTKWGAKWSNAGLVGQNAMGRMLMRRRERLLTAVE
jgi:predicted NAD-dependent protein-ADP-ribosyltransferase YbiA (DUF1768 family)